MDENIPSGIIHLFPWCSISQINNQSVHSTCYVHDSCLKILSTLYLSVYPCTENTNKYILVYYLYLFIYQIIKCQKPYKWSGCVTVCVLLQAPIRTRAGTGHPSILRCLSRLRETSFSPAWASKWRGLDTRL